MAAETKPDSPDEGAQDLPGAPDPATPGGETHTTARAPLDAAGMERPKFLLDYPEDPALERLIAAFESGNYALIRRDADKVAETAATPEVRDAALELRRRIEPDPLAKYLLAIAALLLVYLVVWAYFQAGK
jgi:hypothetical protein